MRWLRGSALALAAMLALGAPAAARSEKTLAYPREQAWPAAVRFLVVDERLKIVDKDAEAGYALFELRDEGKTFRGSLEVMTVVVDGRPLVRFVMKIEDRPSWLEAAMLTRLEKKLRDELGSPAPAPSRRERDRDREAPRKDKDGARDGAREAPSDPPRPDDGGPPISPTP